MEVLLIQQSGDEAVKGIPAPVTDLTRDAEMNQADGESNPILIRL